MGQRARWVPVAVTGAVAALMVGAAVVTANEAACATPGSYVVAPGGVQLIGGCLHRDDLPVAPPADERHPQPPAHPLGD